MAYQILLDTQYLAPNETHRDLPGTGHHSSERGIINGHRTSMTWYGADLFRLLGPYENDPDVTKVRVRCSFIRTANHDPNETWSDKNFVDCFISFQSVPSPNVYSLSTVSNAEALIGFASKTTSGESNLEWFESSNVFDLNVKTARSASITIQLRRADTGALLDSDWPHTLFAFTCMPVTD